MNTLRWMKRLSFVTWMGMGLVLLQGALVTQSESGRGCGDDWPLCHGKFIPAYTLESLIEYSHRLISAGVGLLVLVTVIASFVWLSQWRIRIGALIALAFTVVQAILGAMQVKNPQSDAILALHFGFALIAFTMTWIVYRDVHQRWKAAQSYGNATRYAYIPQGGRGISDVRPSLGLRLFVLFVTVYTYGVVYTGAYTSHTGSAAGCKGFPLCNGAWSDLSGMAAIAWGHRLAAYGLVVLVLLLLGFIWKASRTDRRLRKEGLLIFGLVCAQIGSGVLNLVLLGTESYLFATLLHTVLVALLFAVLSMLSIAVWQRRE